MFRLPITLYLYIARQFLLNIGLIFLTFAVLVMLIDALELVRRSHNRDIPFFVFFQMLFLKFPIIGQKMMPFVMLISTVITYTKLSRNNELAIIRSAGVSVWEFLAPALFSALVVGILMTTMINPLASTMITAYEKIEGKYLHGRSSFMEISSSGLWLRQKVESFEDPNNPGEIIVHASDVDSSKPKELALNNVTMFIHERQDIFTKRLDAKRAVLLDGFWRLREVVFTTPDGNSKFIAEYFLETDLTIYDIHQSFAPPETISFWELPEFIAKLDKSGFSALPHRLQWHNLLANPVLYIGMVLLASLFSMSPARNGTTGLLITSSIITGFFIYFFINLVSSFGLSGSMPVFLAAWIPVTISILTGLWLLLHFEDG